jgi:hypothetical protein
MKWINLTAIAILGIVSVVDSTFADQITSMKRYGKISLDQSKGIAFEQFLMPNFSFNVLQARNKFPNSELVLGGIAEGDLQRWHGAKIITLPLGTYDSGTALYFTQVILDGMVNLNDWSTVFFSGSGSYLFQTGPDANYTYIPHAFITFGNLDRFPLYLTAGINTIPFGYFNGTGTWDIPLTADYFYPQQAPAITFGYANNSWNINTTIYRDQSYYEKHFTLNLSYKNMLHNINYTIDAGYVTNLNLDTTGTPRINPSRKNTFINTDAGNTYDINAILNYNIFTLTGEYVWGSREVGLNNATPNAFSITLNYMPTLLGKATTFGLGYSDAQHLREIPSVLSGNDQIPVIISGVENSWVASISRAFFSPFFILGVDLERDRTFENETTYTYTLDLSAYV